MLEEFEAQSFAARVRDGEFDRDLDYELRKLSLSQLESVASILLMRGRSTEVDGKDPFKADE